MALKFYTSVVKGLKPKVRKIFGLSSTFVEVTGEKLVGEGERGWLFGFPLSWIGLRLQKQVLLLKVCVRYIFASLFFTFTGEHLSNKEKYFLFHFKSSFRFWDNQILTFSEMLWRHQMPKDETPNTFYWVNWEVNTV